MGYEGLFRATEATLARIRSEAETLWRYDAYQFPYYSKVVMERMDPAPKAERRERVFADDFGRAFELRGRIASKV